MAKYYIAAGISNVWIDEYGHEGMTPYCSPPEAGWTFVKTVYDGRYFVFSEGASIPVDYVVVETVETAAEVGSAEWQNLINAALDRVRASCPPLATYSTATPPCAPAPITPTPAVAVIAVSTEPVAGDIYVDGHYFGAGSATVYVEEGSHTVSFGSVAGYVTPASQSVYVKLGEIVSVVGHYTPAPPATGTIVVKCCVDDVEVPATVNVRRVG